MPIHEILCSSTYDILEGFYNIAKVESDFVCSEIFMTVVDDLETTVIYKSGTAIKGVIEEKNNYRLVGINVSIPFFSPGFIAKISDSLAKKGVSILVVSTFSRDYFIVSNENLSVAVNEIENLGIKPNNGI